MSAYLATNDSQAAQAIANEIKQFDPSSTLPGRVLGNTYLKMGVDAATAQQYDEALKYFDLAAAQGDPEVAVTANVQAAFRNYEDRASRTSKKMQSYADKALASNPTTRRRISPRASR